LNYLEKYNFWLENEHFSDEAKKELHEAMKKKSKTVSTKTCSLVPEACAVKSLWVPIG